MIADGLHHASQEMDSFLMIGQSNMAGRGDMADVKPIRNPQCHMLRNGRWQPMREPINPDRPIFEGRYRSGVSLAASFAESYAKDKQRNVGLIPCADGGTKIALWQPGELLFDHAVLQTKLAQRTSVLKGILWHQGESDCLQDEDVEAYAKRFLTVMEALREQVGNVPVVIGQLHPMTGGIYEVGDRVAKLNAILGQLARELPCCAIARVEDLRLKEDGLHFDAVSCRELGKRYYEQYKKLL